MYRKNAWKKYADNQSVVFDFAEDYKRFLSECKTERLVTRFAVKLLEKKGFVSADKIKNAKKGDKIYFVNKKLMLQSMFLYFRVTIFLHNFFFLIKMKNRIILEFI